MGWVLLANPHSLLSGIVPPGWKFRSAQSLSQKGWELQTRAPNPICTGLVASASSTLPSKFISGSGLSQHSDVRGNRDTAAKIKRHTKELRRWNLTSLSTFSPSMGSLWLVLSLLQSHRGLCGLRTVLPYPGASCEPVTSGEVGAPILVLLLEQAPTETHALWLSPSQGLQGPGSNIWPLSL